MKNRYDSVDEARFLLAHGGRLERACANHYRGKTAFNEDVYLFFNADGTMRKDKSPDFTRDLPEDIYTFVDSAHVLELDKGGIFESEHHLALHLTGSDQYFYWKELNSHIGNYPHKTRLAIRRIIDKMANFVECVELCGLY